MVGEGVLREGEIRCSSTVEVRGWEVRDRVGRRSGARERSRLRRCMCMAAWLQLGWKVAGGGRDHGERVVGTGAHGGRRTS